VQVEKRPKKETLVKVENLGKKFCRKLKRSLWYGIRDIGAELIGSKRSRVKLRKEEFWALKDVNFEIKQGELVGLIGPNGAGKTTFLRLLSGLIKPDVGQITVRGKIQALIALGAGFNPVLTARENIYINGAVLGFSKKEMDKLLEDIMDFAEISEFIDMPVQSYSSGMQVRLGFSVAVNLKPDILIVDEVLAVGDAAFRRKARQKMMELLHSGISVLFVSHNMALISAITSRCIYLDKGRMITIGPSDEVTSLYLNDSIKRSKAGVGQNHETKFLMASAYLTVPEVFVLKKVKFYNSSGDETHEFKTLDNIKISFELEFLEKMTDVLLALNIRGQVDEVVISSSKMQLNTISPNGLVSARCEIKKNHLREGNYNVGFYVSDNEGGALFKSLCVGSFSILADFEIIKSSDSTRGFMVMDAEWNVDA
jgi:lipopolysaccharide transport system ATP-binding protein